ncbi:Gti1/Pac2 family-domain-containing protein [Gilbertella persicaria]|uniref:Gti1/Pac2 family-domain-containing protein n=1 Tax=Gilbertella persicaria TaxID=101096 RepID=UPI00221F92E1|nr:Gti1/Pac2 family-domain-containing protein [Gilbertella persicaria]KAI8058928.1 Gti1/Pac2 family-domain-containing protein [Gilbertella persicaria]
MPINETFNGFIETTTDALLIFEACRRGILPKISRRLQDRERGAIRSGTIYVFDEKESGIRRWTDGLVWSPSRILGNFLIYRELDGRESLHQKQHMEASTSYMANYYTSTSIYDPASEDSLEEQLSSEERDRERNLVGSLTDTYKFKKGGLIKKTISIHLNGSIQHLISYYTKTDVLDAKLATPSSVSEISSLQIAPDLLLKQSFRVPPSVEFAELILKRPSLSPSSTISSASSSTQSYYRKSYGNMKPGTPYSLHDGYRRRYHHHKDLQYEDYHSLRTFHS